MKLPFGKVEKMPETLAELTALCPELIAQAKQEAIASIDVEGAKQEAVTAALAIVEAKHTAEMERTYGVIEAALSGDIASKVKVIVASGVTGEQYKAIGASLIPPATDSAKETQLKTDLLTALQDSGAKNPGHEGPAKGKQFDADTDTKAEKQAQIDKLVTDYQAANPTAGYKTAVMAVAEKNPELFRDRT